MTINAITVTPLAITPYNSIWSGILGDFIYTPFHLLADPLVTDEMLDSNSTVTPAVEFNFEGTVTNTGANDGWYTGVAAGDTRIQVANDAAIDTFCTTSTLTTGQCIIISFYLYLPAGGTTATNGILAYGRSDPTHAGFKMTMTSTERMAIDMSDGTQLINSGVTPAQQAADSIMHYMGVIEKTATGYQTHIYTDGTLVKSSSDVASSGAGAYADLGLSIGATHNINDTINWPMEADVQLSDLIMARTTIDATAELAELAARQSRSRTSLVRKWADVL